MRAWAMWLGVAAAVVMMLGFAGGAEARQSKKPRIARPVPAMPEQASVIRSLKDGGYLLMLRHTKTDPSEKDTMGEEFADCARQRNLNDAGREQARQLGAAITALGIPIGEVLSSPMCRCVETAELAFGRHTVERDLYGDEPERQARRKGMIRPPAAGTNTVWSTHVTVIEPIAGIKQNVVPEGTAVVLRPDSSGGYTLAAIITTDDLRRYATPGGLPPAAENVSGERLEAAAAALDAALTDAQRAAAVSTGVRVRELSPEARTLAAALAAAAAGPLETGAAGCVSHQDSAATVMLGRAEDGAGWLVKAACEDWNTTVVTREGVMVSATGVKWSEAGDGGLMTLARELAASVTDEQRGPATMRGGPAGAPGAPGAVSANEGLSGRAMTGAQRKLLMEMVRGIAARAPAGTPTAAADAITGHNLDFVLFAFAGTGAEGMTGLRVWGPGFAATGNIEGGRLRMAWDDLGVPD